MNPAAEMRLRALQVTHCAGAGSFLGLGNSLHPPGNVVCRRRRYCHCHCHCHQPGRVVLVGFVTTSGFSLAHGALRQVVFWA